VNGGEVGGEGVEGPDDLEAFVDTLRNAVVIVWMMAGIAERKTARGDEALEGVASAP
jgi:hypothetical protein